MEVFRGECDCSQFSGVKRKGKSTTGGGGRDIKCNSLIKLPMRPDFVKFCHVHSSFYLREWIHYPDSGTRIALKDIHFGF